MVLIGCVSVFLGNSEQNVMSKKNESSGSRDATQKDVFAMVIVVFLILCPLTMVFLYPNDPAVDKYLGNGKMFLPFGMYMLVLYIRKLVLKHIFGVED
ncbi:hypothetical protein NBRC116583_33130 [Arenicella sp. 4NH20-0111]